MVFPPFSISSGSPRVRCVSFSACDRSIYLLSSVQYWISVFRATLSTQQAYYALLVHRSADLPTPSFRFCLTADTLGFSYSSYCKACSGLSPYRYTSCRAHSNKGRRITVGPNSTSIDIAQFLLAINIAANTTIITAAAAAPMYSIVEPSFPLSFCSSRPSSAIK